MEAIQIDIRKVIENKNKKLAKRLPPFIYSLIEKLVHLKQINEILRECNGMQGAEFAAGALNYLKVKGYIKYAKGAEEVLNHRDVKYEKGKN